MILIDQKIIKEAGTLERRLQTGNLNLNELRQFLAKLGSISPADAKVKSSKKQERFQQQLDNLDRGRSGKVKY